MPDLPMALNESAATSYWFSAAETEARAAVTHRESPSVSAIAVPIHALRSEGNYVQLQAFEERNKLIM